MFSNISRGKLSFYLGIFSVLVPYTAWLFFLVPINNVNPYFLSLIIQLISGVVGAFGLSIGVRAIKGKQENLGFAIAGVVLGGYSAISFVMTILSLIISYVVYPKYGLSV